MILAKLKQIDFKLIVQLVIAATFSGLIPLLFEPFFKSIFTPEDYGNYDLFLKFSMIFTLLMTFKSETIISSIIPSDIEDYFYKCLNLCLALFLLYVLLYSILVLLKILPLIITIYLALISGLLFSLISITITYLLRLNRKKYVTLQKPIRRIFEIIILVLFIVISKVPYALEISTIFALFLSLIPLIKESNIDKSIISIDFKTPIILIKKSKFIMLGELLNTISLSFLSFFIFFNYSLIDLGVIELSFKIMSIPMLLVCTSMGIVIQNNIGKLVSEQKPILKNVKLFFFFLLLMSILFCLLIFFYSGALVENFFDKKWENSVTYTLLLLPHLFLYIVFSPLSRVLYALVDNHSIKNWQFLKLCILLSSILLHNQNLNQFLFYFGIISAFSYLTSVFFIFKSIRKYNSKLSITV